MRLEIQKKANLEQWNLEFMKLNFGAAIGGGSPFYLCDVMFLRCNRIQSLIEDMKIKEDNIIKSNKSYRKPFSAM